MLVYVSRHKLPRNVNKHGRDFDNLTNLSMYRVTTGSRLHFGLIALEPDAPRRFGGAGLMVERPVLCVRATPAADWSAHGPLAERALAFGRRFAASVTAERPDLTPTPRLLVVEQVPPEHAGLGTGTQLGLAVARAVAAAWGLDLAATDLARHVGRGLRSGLGVYGFAQGGFLVDGGKRDGTGLAPLLVRQLFPEDWRILLARPTAAAGLHGQAERHAFSALTSSVCTPGRTDALCQLVLLGMLPALAERDLGTFGDALHEFNRRVGEAFGPVQGGPYAGPAVAELVEWFRRQGVRGVGQSSWGPTVFAVVADEAAATVLAERLRHGAGTSAVAVEVTRARNVGAAVSAVS